MSAGERPDPAELGAFFARHTPEATESVSWAGGTMPIRIAYYVGEATPPEAYVTSVRAVVTFGGAVLVVRNPDTVHALPGGRREPGETFEETLRREIREETGLAIGCPRPLGVVHLRHVGSKPPRYPFPFPDFLWAVFLAPVDRASRIAVHDEYELDARFATIDQALERIDLGSRIYVHAAARAIEQADARDMFRR